jgi:hypothetical protein
MAYRSVDLRAPAIRTGGKPLKIELLHVPDCRHADGARRLVVECLGELGLENMAIDDREGGDFPSPTILINGRDVMGASAVSAAACRLDVPMRERALTALRRAASP